MAGWWRRGSADSKVHPGPYIDAHLRALVHAQTSEPRITDLLWLYLPPSVLAFVALAWRWTMTTGDAALVGVPTGLLAAYLVQFIFQMFDRANAFAETNPEPGPQTSEHSILLQELNAHGAYAGFVSIFAAMFILMAGLRHRVDFWEHLFVALAYGMLVHLVLLLLLIIRRAFLYSDRRLREARTNHRH